MVSVRIPGELAARLERAAQTTGATKSAIVRRALERELQSEPIEMLLERWRDVIGVVGPDEPYADGGVAHRTGDAFVELLEQERNRGQ